MAGPTYKPAIDPATLLANQQSQKDKITPEAAQINERLQSLPAYREYVQDVLLGHSPPMGKSEQLVAQAKAAGIDIPDSLIFDPYTGQVREKIWNESNSGWSGLIYVGAAIAAGLTAGAALGAVGGTATTAGIGGSVATSVPEAAVLSSSTIAPTLGTLPAVAASGTVPSALGIGGAVEAAGGIGATAGIGDAVAGGVLPSSTIAPTAGTLPAVASSGAVGTALTPGIGMPSASTIGQIASLAGKGIGAATQSAGQTQLTNNNLGLEANGQNIQGQQAFEQELMNRAKLEADQRKGALANIYRQSATQNPVRSPYNTSAPVKYSQAYLEALEQASQSGQAQLKAPQQYSTSSLAPLAPYVPYKPDTDQSTMQTVGNWLSPTLSTIGAIASLYGRG